MIQRWLVGTVFLLCFALGAGASAEQKDSSKAKVRYRKSKEINFEKLLIEGQLRRKQISVVTGDSPDGTDGLLRLRENFLDRVAMDAGEGVK